MKILIYILSGVLVVGGGDFFLSKKYYSLGFETAEQQYKRMLAKEGYALFDPKSGEWRLIPKIDRNNENLDDYIYSLETELSLVKAQSEAQGIIRKKK